MPARVEFHQHQAVAQVTLTYPKRFNAMSRAMWRELRHIFESIQRSTDVRCVLIYGHGAHFCAGGEFPAMVRTFVRAAISQSTAVSGLTR